MHLDSTGFGSMEKMTFEERTKKGFQLKKGTSENLTNLTINRQKKELQRISFLANLIYGFFNEEANFQR